MKRTALVAGATGLVGSQLLARLLEDPAYGTVTVVGRRPPAVQHRQLRFIASDFRDLAGLGRALAADDVFCCLGTTLKQAGSRAAFEDVDHRMVLDLARATHAAGAQQFLVVSAAGASLRSPAYYSRVKAQMEAAVAAVGFEAVHVVRPSLLLGSREDSRPGEALAQKLAPLLARFCVGPLARYRPVRAGDVAETMLGLALRGSPGLHIHHLPLAD